MFDINHNALEIAEAHQQVMREQVQKYRLLKKIKAENPRFRERILVQLGDILIAAGTNLRKRYTPVMCSNYETCKSAGRAGIC